MLVGERIEILNCFHTGLFLTDTGSKFQNIQASTLQIALTGEREFFCEVFLKVFKSFCVTQGLLFHTSFTDS